jgi:hypothetical protein
MQRCCECTRRRCSCPHGRSGSTAGEQASRRPPPPITLATDTLQLLPSDAALDIRIFTDNGIAEVRSRSTDENAPLN